MNDEPIEVYLVTKQWINESHDYTPRLPIIEVALFDALQADNYVMRAQRLDPRYDWGLCCVKVIPRSAAASVGEIVR